MKSSSKKKIKISWKKDKTITGYLLYISKNKSFGAGTKKKTYKMSTSSKMIGGWESKRHIM